MSYYPYSSQTAAHYRLVGPSGAVATFNDEFDPSYVGMLTEVTGLDSAEVREAATDLVEADGGSHGNFYFGRRPIVLNGRVFGHGSHRERALRLDRARRASLAMRDDAVLSWKPNGRYENLVENPVAGLDTTGHGITTSAGTTVTRVTTDLPNKPGTSTPFSTGISWAGTVAATAGANSVGRYSNGATTGRIPVEPGRWYGASGSLRLNSVTGTMNSIRIRVYFYTSTGASAGTADLTIHNSPVIGETYHSSGMVQAPPDAVTAVPRIYTAHPNPTTFALAYSGITFGPGEPTLMWRDAETDDYHWAGARHASATGDFIEQFTPVRRQQPFRETGAWNKDFQIALVSEYAYIFSTYARSFATGVAMENRGNAPSYPRIRITGLSSNPTVSTDGRTFRTTGLTLASGETVEFDMLTHTGYFVSGPRAGQSANRYINFTTTDWPYLGGLGTTQTFAATGGGSATITYRDVWA